MCPRSGPHTVEWLLLLYVAQIYTLEDSTRRETTHFSIVGTISQWHEISWTLTRSNVTREEKQIEYNQHCQLALLAHVRFQSETQSIQNNMDDVFCFHSMFVAARFQLWKHAIAGRRRLLTLIGCHGYYVRGSPIKSRVREIWVRQHCSRLGTDK